jgi:cellulose synthase/poly-beta-1,6-N-acetylglucosamine synthase-like glycosyltransferase
MKRPPFISFVIETFTLMHDYEPGVPSEGSLVKVIEALRGLSYPAESMEIIVVLDEQSEELASFLGAAYPDVKLCLMKGAEYFSMKTFGAQSARGDILALLDSDCVPYPQWAQVAAGRINEGADLVAGKTRYRPQSLAARTYGVFDFGHVQGDSRSEANCFMANNAAIRRELFLKHPFDARARRSGADYMLACELKAAGYRLLYEPALFAAHEYDIETMGFVIKRVRAGYDAVNVSRLDEAGVVGETRLSKAGPFAPFAFFLNRMFFDAARFVRNRRDLGIPVYALGYFLCASLLMRSIELIAGLITLVSPRYFKDKYGW